MSRWLIRKRSSRQKFYAVKFIVEGRGSFPVNMFLYDQCSPASNDDLMQTVLHLGPTWSREIAAELRKIHLRGFYPFDSFAYASGEYPTRDRWKLFGWPVVLGSVQDIRI